MGAIAGLQAGNKMEGLDMNMVLSMLQMEHLHVKYEPVVDVERSCMFVCDDVLSMHCPSETLIKKCITTRFPGEYIASVPVKQPNENLNEFTLRSLKGVKGCTREMLKRCEHVLLYYHEAFASY